MTTETLIVAMVLSFIALTRRSGGGAIGVLVFSMLIWPSYLTISIAISEMSVPRIVALVLLVKFVVTGQHRKLGYGKVDALIMVIWLWTIAANLIAGSSAAHVSQMVGRGFDTVLMYFTARVALTDLKQMEGALPWLIITALSMCAVGAYESVMSASPYQGLIAYRKWSWINKADEYRWGLLRAKASTSVSIYFGMAMVVIVGFLWSFRGYAKSSFICFIAIAAGIVAALSSMSSGPWVACAFFIFLSMYERKPQLIKPTFVLFVFVSLFLEMASNRHFYNLIDYIALDSHNAWYRTRLMEIAFSHWPEYWLVGVGDNWPHHWAALLDGRGHIDVVNNFLIVALYGGVPALLMYISTHYLAIKKIIVSWRESIDGNQKKALFGFSVTLIALDISSLSVGLYGPVLLLSHVLLGLTISATTTLAYQSEISEEAKGFQGDDLSGYSSCN